LSTYWADFDKVYMKKKFVYDWPHVKDDQEKFSEGINELSAKLKDDGREELKIRLTAKKQTQTFDKEFAENLKDDINKNQLNIELLDKSQIKKDF